MGCAQESANCSMALQGCATSWRRFRAAHLQRVTLKVAPPVDRRARQQPGRGRRSDDSDCLRVATMRRLHAIKDWCGIGAAGPAVTVPLRSGLGPQLLSQHSFPCPLAQRFRLLRHGQLFEVARTTVDRQGTRPRGRFSRKRWRERPHRRVVAAFGQHRGSWRRRMSARDPGERPRDGHIELVLGRRATQRPGGQCSRFDCEPSQERWATRLADLHQRGGPWRLESGQRDWPARTRPVASSPHRWVADPGPPGAQPHEERAQG